MQRVNGAFLHLFFGSAGQFVLLAACTATDDDDAAVDDDDDRHVADQAACDAAVMTSCPPGYGFEMIRGAGHEDLTVVDLSQAGTPVCGGLGGFVPPIEPQTVDRVGFNVTRNSVCTAGCFGGCPFWGVCFAKDERGEVAHVSECSEITEERCEAFVRDSIGEGTCDDG